MDDDMCSDTDEEESIENIKSKIPQVESDIQKASEQLLKIDELVKLVLDSLADQDLSILKKEVNDATKKVQYIEDIIENLKNQIPFYKKKLANRKESLTEIDD